MKVGVIGAGAVGATTAYALVMRGVCREIILVDLNKQRSQAEADDILHAVPFAHPVRVSAGDYADLRDSSMVIITAGAAQKPGAWVAGPRPEGPLRGLPGAPGLGLSQLVISNSCRLVPKPRPGAGYMRLA